MRIRKAFTLIELLVVIAIIALLLSIIVPSLYKGRELARMAVCGTNLKSLVMAARLWADDNNGYAVALKWWRDPMHTHPNGQVEDNSKVSLMPYLAASIKNKGDSLVCPSAANVKFYALSEDYQTQGHEQTFTYAVNGYMVLNYNNRTPGVIDGPRYDEVGSGRENGPRTAKGGYMYWDERGSTKLSTIRNPARTTYFMDHEYYFIARWFFDPTRKPEEIQSDQRFWFQTRWHQKRPADIYGIGMIGWVDGHVSREPRDFAEVVPNSESGRRWTMYFYGQ
ncbi:MAG TPA: type II secretion system protein [Anaerohalosphaeraceae bacterium]|nr:type II secretion system protein [Anaerohalosphaeraceae bacterium]